MIHAAVDLGANGGKIFAGEIGEGLNIEEIHRFDNRPVESDGRFIWDVQNLRDEVVKGLRKSRESKGEIKTFGIDTWGLDFGLIKNG